LTDEEELDLILEEKKLEEEEKRLNRLREDAFK